METITINPSATSLLLNVTFAPSRKLLPYFGFNDVDMNYSFPGPLAES